MGGRRGKHDTCVRCLRYVRTYCMWSRPLPLHHESPALTVETLTITALFISTDGGFVSPLLFCGLCSIASYSCAHQSTNMNQPQKQIAETPRTAAGYCKNTNDARWPCVSSQTRQTVDDIRRVIKGLFPLPVPLASWFWAHWCEA